MSIEKYKELYDERAGIMQFDGGLSREKAEEKALSEVSAIWAEDQNLKFDDGNTYRLIAQFKRDLKK